MKNSKLIKSALIFCFACLLALCALAVRKNRVVPLWNGQPYELSDVNSFDAFFAHPYSEVFDKAGDFCIAGAHCFVILVCFFVPFIRVLRKKEKFLPLFTEGFIYCETAAFVFGFFRLLKSFAGRIRPYMYFENPSLEGIADGDFISSWPSGHSSMAFFALGFFVCWILFNGRRFSRTVRIALTALMCVFAVVTAFLRIQSGNHFPSDVICGAFLGLAVSVSVYLLNKKILACQK